MDEFKMSKLCSTCHREKLPFVLESQWSMIQGKMLVRVPFILQFSLAHCGVDFTFHFDWLAYGGSTANSTHRQSY
ncbi:hypothetical protein Poli38472_014316 [Pythium oligandrum]|uniref:Uncharacterized protein n=1 Tax=Pythium oligandrum TaxID=41045 RepID=A0A8K1C7K6_PYTOL|nr:hypothetical protein Poli38472_014316 [Pythium oligandrum]|eukprot:TMW57713.1 hypothetical protein Poli38472_014316 [Pythium oligandrum]